MPEEKNSYKALSLVIASLSLLVAARSCQNAGKALHISQTVFEGQQRLQLLGEVSKGQPAITLRSAGEGCRIETGAITFPSDLGLRPVHFRDSVVISLQDLKDKLEDRLRDDPNTPKTLRVQIDCTYIAVGTRFRRISDHLLTYAVEYVENGQQPIGPKVTFTSFSAVDPTTEHAAAQKP